MARRLAKAEVKTWNVRKTGKLYVLFSGNKMPGCLALEIRFYTCRPDAYTINIAPDGSVLSENPKDGNLRCTDMLTRSVVHDGIFMF